MNRLDLMTEEDMHYQEVADNAPIIVWMTNAQGEGIYGNGKWEEYTGQTFQEAVKFGWSNAIHPEDVERVLQTFLAAVNKKSIYFSEYRLRKATGEYRWVVATGSPRVGKDGGFRGYLGGIIEIHERKSADEALFASHERFKAAITAVEGVMWSTDAKGNIVERQWTWEKLTGQAFEEYKGYGWTAALHPDDLDGYLQAVNQSLAAGTPLNFEHRLRTADGTWRRYSVKASPVRDPDGTVREWVGVHTDVTEKREYESRIEYLATHDALTHLPNRLLFEGRLTHLVQQRGTRQHAVLFMDLNRFKFVNDGLGHDIGDKLLIEVANRLRSNVRVGDTVARFGGDEFVFLFEDIKNEADVTRLAHKILRLTAKPIKVGEHELIVTASIGASIYPRDGTTPATLLKHADQAMYRAKALGGNDIQFFDEAFNAGMAERLALENDLRHAVARNELVLHYQPKMHVNQNRVFCLEALVRWNHPKRGLVSPIEFIPVAEEAGLISQIGEWILEEACAQLGKWKKQGMQNIRISVNLSAHQLNSPSYLQNLKKVLKRTEADPHCIELEITESTLMENIRSYEPILEGICALGIRMAIDDFGTGYSSLSYLKRLPIQTLKIDRSFIQDVTDDKEGAAIVCATISMAQSMGLNIIAEGVETKEHVAFLLKNGCELMQGYYFSHPLPPAQVEAFIKERDLLSNAQENSGAP